jgi:hypothetical protein
VSSRAVRVTERVSSAAQGTWPTCSQNRRLGRAGAGTPLGRTSPATSPGSAVREISRSPRTSGART